MNRENISSDPQTQIENEAFWKKHYERCQSSDMSRAQYCRDNHLNYERFGYWIGKWTVSHSNFVAVKIKDPVNEPKTMLCTMTLKNGAEIKIYDLSVLSFVLERLS